MKHYIWGDSPITQEFGENPAAYAKFGLASHNGVDVGTWLRVPLHAAEDGTIVEVSSDPYGYGLTVYLAGDSGRGWRYGHLMQIDVNGGERATRGQRLGLSGNSGNSSGPHLHLGMRPANPSYQNGWNGYVDPMPTLVALQDEHEQMEAGASGGPTQEDDEMALVAALEAQVHEISAERDRYITALQECNRVKHEIEDLARSAYLKVKTRYRRVSNADIDAAVLRATAP